MQPSAPGRSRPAMTSPSRRHPPTRLRSPGSRVLLADSPTSLAQAHEAFSADGSIANDVLQARFAETIGCFLELVEAATHYRSLKKQWVEFLGEKPDAATDRVELRVGAA